MGHVYRHRARRTRLNPDPWYTVLFVGLLVLAGSLLAGGLVGVFFDPFYFWFQKPVPKGLWPTIVVTMGLLGVAYIVVGLAGIGATRYRGVANIALFSSLYWALTPPLVLTQAPLLTPILAREVPGQWDIQGLYSASLALVLGAGIARATRWYIGLPLALYGLYEAWLISTGKPYDPVSSTLEAVYLSLITLYTGLGVGLWWTIRGRSEVSYTLRRPAPVATPRRQPAKAPVAAAPARSEKKLRLPPECLAIGQWARMVAERGEEAIAGCWEGRSIYGYHVEKLVGVGGYGLVLRARSTGGRIVAIKVVLPVLGEAPGGRDKRRSTVLATEMLGSLYKESASLKELSEKSPFIVKLIGIYYDEERFREALRNPRVFLEYPPAIVMEYMGGGDLNKLLTESFSRADRLRLDESWKKSMAGIIALAASALAAIHEDGYVHSDIKPHNILFNKKPPKDPLTLLQELRKGVETLGGKGIVAKLSDLGSAVRIGSEIQGYTPIYAPPEIIEYYEFRCSDPQKSMKDPWCQANKPKAHPSQDIFALGMTALQALGALTPEGLFTLQLNTNPANLQYMLRDTMQQLGIPGELRGLIAAMLHPRPEKRPSAREVAIAFSKYAGIRLPPQVARTGKRGP